MTTKFGKQVHTQDLTQMRLIKQVLLIPLCQDHLTNKKYYISITTVPMTTKISRMVTYFEECLLIFRKPFDFFALWDHVTNYNHYISTTAVPISSKLGRKVPYLDGLLPIKSYDPLWSRGKLKSLYLHYQIAYDHQILQDGNLTWLEATHNVTRPFDYVVLWDKQTM